MKRQRKAPAKKTAAAAEPAANTEPIAPADPASLSPDRTVMQPTSEPTQVKDSRSELIDTDRTLRQDTGSAPRAAPRGSTAAPAATGSRYRILSLHARGGLGAVYVAEDTELRRRVALKEIEI